MVHYLRATVVSLLEQSAVLEFPNGDRLEWPINELHADPQYLSSIREGEKVTITLSRTPDLINELLLNYSEDAPAVSATPL